MDYEKQLGDGNSSVDKGFTVGVTEVDSEHQHAGGEAKETIRALKPRHVQIMAISGAIGTGLFVGSGAALARSGPLSLLLGYMSYAVLSWITFNAMGEMICYLPIDGSFIHFAGRYVNKSFGFAIGWLYTYNQSVIVAAEVSAVASLINFWNDTINNGVWCAICITLFLVLNLFGARIYGEGEFWVSIAKILLIIGLILFAFITMCGGNPAGDAFGFRYWKNPGPMAEYLTTGALGRFSGYWSVLIQAAFAMGGPDYVSLAAPETMAPRRVLPSVFRRIIFRLVVFYVLGVLAVGVLVPYDDPRLGGALPGAGSSPFVLGAKRLGVPVLPHIINAVIMSSAFSCGLEICFATSRSLYSLALDGNAPAFYKKTRNGVPIYCVLTVCLFGCLAFMSASGNSAEVFNWIVNLTGSGIMLIFGLFHVIYIRWYHAMKVQGIDRSNMVFKRRGQIYMSYFALCAYALVLLTNGFPVFVKGNWSIRDFFFAYLSIVVFVIAYLFDAIFRRRTFRSDPLAKLDLVSGKAEVDELEASDPPLRQTKAAKFERWLWG